MHGASSISFWIGMTFQTSFRDEFQSSPSEQLKYRWFLLKPQSWRRSCYKSARSISHAAVGSALHPHSRVGFCNIISIPHDNGYGECIFGQATHQLDICYQTCINCGSPVSPKSVLPVASLIPLRTVPQQLVKSKGCKHPETAANMRIYPNDVDTRLPEELHCWVTLMETINVYSLQTRGIQKDGQLNFRWVIKVLEIKYI